MICDGSHKLKVDLETIRVTDIGMFQIPDTLLETYEKIPANGVKGGV